MPTIIKDKQINFKVNSEYFEMAKEVFQENGLDITSAFNEFVQEVAITKTLPFKTIEEKEREKLVSRLQEEISASYEELKASKGVSIEDARKAVLG
ncbi:TPA: toxin-antitoxin system antitoxin subunit [Streptococcus suis]